MLAAALAEQLFTDAFFPSKSNSFTHKIAMNASSFLKKYWDIFHTVSMLQVEENSSLKKVA